MKKVASHLTKILFACALLVGCQQAEVTTPETTEPAEVVEEVETKVDPAAEEMTETVEETTEETAAY
ncbi:MAG TPA: hypothetical protein V6C96_00080 [Vampirovibrionales bacterium]